MEEFLDDDIKGKDINILIKEYMAFIIKTVSHVTGRYVCIDNDEEFSIGLLAFKEAVDLEEYKDSLLLNKVVDFLVENATITEVPEITE